MNLKRIKNLACFYATFLTVIISGSVIMKKTDKVSEVYNNTITSNTLHKYNKDDVIIDPNKCIEKRYFLNEVSILISKDELTNLEDSIHYLNEFNLTTIFETYNGDYLKIRNINTKEELKIINNYKRDGSGRLTKGEIVIDEESYYVLPLDEVLDRQNDPTIFTKEDLNILVINKDDLIHTASIIDYPLGQAVKRVFNT